jgi:UDP-N-acetylmuramoyl-L-alanyl-D-glutamate--2,6-diaminopimelate ligase
MGKVVSELADALVVTSDNPRNEDPMQIIQEILEGVSGEYAIEEDRAKAIGAAIANAGVEDTVLIAGKGHELYQEIKKEKQHFSDVEEAEKVLKHLEVIVA